MQPHEFGRLQPHEFRALLDGYQWRQEQTENTAAFFLSYLLNIEGKALKRTITPKEILKPLRRQRAKKDRAEDEAELRKIFKKQLAQDE